MRWSVADRHYPSKLVNFRSASTVAPSLTPEAYNSPCRIAASNAFSIAGDGDTIAAIHKFGVSDGIDYISTAGGAFLEFLEGKALPAVAALEARAQRRSASRAGCRGAQPISLDYLT